MIKVNLPLSEFLTNSAPEIFLIFSMQLNLKKKEKQHYGIQILIHLIV